MDELFLIKGETLTAIANTLRNCGVAGGPHFTTDPAINAGNGNLVPNSVEVYYVETVDSQGAVDYGTHNFTNGDTVNDCCYDVFIAYDFLTDNKNILVPVIYKTDMLVSEYATEVDRNDCFYYQGKAELDGDVYDKWRKIENADYTWNGEEKMYIYTNEIIIFDGAISPIDFPNKIGEVYQKAINTYKNANEEVY